jgi:hypothetical protein
MRNKIPQNEIADLALCTPYFHNAKACFRMMKSNEKSILKSQQPGQSGCQYNDHAKRISFVSSLNATNHYRTATGNDRPAIISIIRPLPSQ